MEPATYAIGDAVEVRFLRVVDGKAQPWWRPANVTNVYPHQVAVVMDTGGLLAVGFAHVRHKTKVSQ